MFDFTITTDDPQTAAPRCTGIFETPHGKLLTPVFAPVGTQATVKTLTPRDLAEIGATLVLANTYHLYLRPGTKLVARFGGLHSFMGWPGPMLTDSGGFQVFSLAQMRKLDPDGVTFRSHIDGSLHRFTPESAIASQENLGADIIMCLDECPEPLDRAYNEEALARTHAWAARCQAAQAASRPGALRHRPGRHLSRSARRERPHPARPGLPRLRHRRAERGRDQGGDVRHARRDRAGAARGQAALSDGRGRAGGHRRGRGARHRHLRLRAADPRGPQRRPVDPPRPASTCATPAMPPIRCRSSRAATATPASTSAAPTCATCSRPAKSSACTWRRSTTSAS